MKIRTVSTKYDRQHRSWKTTWYVDRKPVRRFFKKKKDAQTYKKDLLKLIHNGISLPDVQEAITLLAGTGLSMAAVVRSGLEALQRNGGAGASRTMTFAQGTEVVMKRALDGNARGATIQSYEALNSVLNQKFGSRIILSITKDEIDAFIKAVPNTKGEVGNARCSTRKTYLQYIRMVMRKAGIPKPLSDLNYGEDEGAIPFFSNDQICRIISAAQPDERGAVILATWATLRPSMLGPTIKKKKNKKEDTTRELDWSHTLPAACIDLERRTIHIPNYCSKDHHSHELRGEYRDASGTLYPGVPDCLWTLLKTFPYKPLTIPWKDFQKKIQKAVGFWIPDGLRHTGATNYNRIYGKAAVMELLTHEGFRLLFEHYVGITTTESARGFYNIKASDFAEAPVVRRIRGERPSREELATTVASQPNLASAARQLGVSVPTLRTWCKEGGVARPGRGGRTKVLLQQSGLLRCDPTDEQKQSDANTTGIEQPTPPPSSPGNESRAA